MLVKTLKVKMLTLKGLKFISNNFQNIGIKALDRGYDNNTFYKYLTYKNERFVIRAKSNRDVLFKNKPINILKLATKYKEKYSTIIKNKAIATIDDS